MKSQPVSPEGWAPVARPGPVCRWFRSRPVPRSTGRRGGRGDLDRSISSRRSCLTASGGPSSMTWRIWARRARSCSGVGSCGLAASSWRDQLLAMGRQLVAALGEFGDPGRAERGGHDIPPVTLNRALVLRHGSGRSDTYDAALLDVAQDHLLWLLAETGLFDDHGPGLQGRNVAAQMPARRCRPVLHRPGLRRSQRRHRAGRLRDRRSTRGTGGMGAPRQTTFRLPGRPRPGRTALDAL